MNKEELLPFIEDGLTLKEIGEKFKIKSSSGVKRWLDKYGLTTQKNITMKKIPEKNLINVQRVKRRNQNEMWFSLNQADYFNKSIPVDEKIKNYYKNH